MVEVAIRLPAIDALRDHPTPRNQRLLATLADDRDEAVRTAAARAQLDALRAAMPGAMEPAAATH